MGSHTWEIIRQGFWASVTGGWFFDPHEDIFCNTFHMYLWLCLLLLPFVLFLVRSYWDYRSFRKIWFIDWLLWTKFRPDLLPQNQTRQSLITKRFQTDFSLHSFFKAGNLGPFKNEKLAQNWQKQILLFSVKFKKGFGVGTPLQTMLFNNWLFLFSDDGLCDSVDNHLPSCNIRGVCNHKDNQS